MFSNLRRCLPQLFCHPLQLSCHQFRLSLRRLWSAEAILATTGLWEMPVSRPTEEITEAEAEAAATRATAMAAATAMAVATAMVMAAIVRAT